MHYCSQCGNVMREFNNYGSRTLNCKECAQEVAYGHKDQRKDQERGRPEEARQEDEEITVSIVECNKCLGAWLEKDLKVDMLTQYGIFFLCPNCGARIFVRF